MLEEVKMDVAQHKVETAEVLQACQRGMEIQAQKMTIQEGIMEVRQHLYILHPMYMRYSLYMQPIIPLLITYNGIIPQFSLHAFPLIW